MFCLGTASTTSGTATTSATISGATSTTATASSSNPCFNGTYWNAIGVTYAGNDIRGTALNQLSAPTCIFIGLLLNQVNYPYGIWVDSSLNVFVSEYRNQCVTIWAPGASSNVVVAGISGSSGSTTNLLSGPAGLYYDEANQNLYISNTGVSDNVMKCSGSSSSQLQTPAGIILDQWQNIYVNDRDNSRIQLFCNGSSIGITIAESGTGGSSLSTPYDIELDSQQNLYII
ncbi:unnamed protein product, partial [Rotaria sp. Silwood1]